MPSGGEHVSESPQTARALIGQILENAADYGERTPRVVAADLPRRAKVENEKIAATHLRVARWPRPSRHPSAFNRPSQRARPSRRIARIKRSTFRQNGAGFVHSAKGVTRCEERRGGKKIPPHPPSLSGLLASHGPRRRRRRLRDRASGGLHRTSSARGSHKRKARCRYYLGCPRNRAKQAEAED